MTAKPSWIFVLSAYIREFIKKKVINRFKFIRRLATKYRRPWQSDITCFNSAGTKKFDKIPYIIRRKDNNVGLLSYFITILGGIAYADENGLIPVVDMKNYPNTYLYDNQVGHVNSWEYYFMQPGVCEGGGISLDDALSCKEYILGRDSYYHRRPPANPKSFYNRNGELDYWRKIFRKYIHFTPAVLERLEAMKKKYQGKRILGLLVRGTDYITLKPKGHPIPPTAEQAIAKAHEVMYSENFNAVYLATEDKNILAKFQAAFGEKLLLPEAEYVDFNYHSKVYLSDYAVNRQNDKYLRGLEYLVSMLFLGTCKGFITSTINGALTAILSSQDGFDYLYVFDLGLYP